MARKGLYKFRWKEQRHIAYDIAVMTAGLVLGVLAITAVFRFAGLMDFGAAVDGASSLRGAAPEIAPISGEAAQTGALNARTSKAQVSGTYPVSGGYPVTGTYSVTIGAEQSNGYAGIGQADVSFIKFSLNPSASANLKELRLDLDGYASAADVTSMQLYYENKLAGQAPVMDAQAIFANLSIALEANKPHQFEVKANISGQALSGDRVQIGLKDGSGIIVRDQDMNTFEIKGSFPVWSGYVSIIGNKIKK